LKGAANPGFGLLIDPAAGRTLLDCGGIAGMWLLFGNKTHLRPVENGRTVEQYCDECEKVQTLVECEVKDRVTVFFVDVGDMEKMRS
jgi:hypothetical protein